MKNTFLALIFIAFLFSTACEKEPEILTAKERIAGTWKVTSTEFLGFIRGGDGSSISFNSCESYPCTGIDYYAPENKTGSFSYTLSDDEKQLIISDTDDSGSGYDGSWDILEFTNTHLIITSENELLGTIRLELEKDE